MTAHGVATRLTAKYGPYWARELAMSSAYGPRLALALRFHLPPERVERLNRIRAFWESVAALLPEVPEPEEATA
jgi:hypothetical protein